ncbi:MAG: hypothetical protein KKD05_11075 [Candidatus Omnitrophica bacterium]|nr:hypothetical protein [Candidatus Omnitrophota bacterium]
MKEIIIFLITMMFFIPFALKKMQRLYLVVPFFLLCFLLINNIGFLDKYTIIDTDTVFHKALIDTLVDKQLFQNDSAIRFYLKTYPRGYHFLFLPFIKYDLSIPQVSKFFGITLALIIPFLFYFLAKEIFFDKNTAFFAGIFCGVASIGHVVYSGLPRSIGLAIFIIALICLFNYHNSKKKIRALVFLNLLMLLLIFIHPYTFTIVWIISVFFFLWLYCQSDKRNIQSIREFLLIFLMLAGYIISLLVMKNERGIALTTWDFMNSHKEICFSRVPYAFIDLHKLITEIGILPIMIFAAALYDYCRFGLKNNKYLNLQALFVCLFTLVLYLILVLNVNALCFLKAHRCVTFISVLMFVSGCMVLKNLWNKIKKSKILIFFYCFILLLPSLNQINQQIKKTKYPYYLQDNNECFASPEEFNEVIDLAEYIEKNIPPDAVIACPMELGDTIRMFAGRAVTSSWKIGGMITTYKDALCIFNQQISNSKLLYANPDYLWQISGADYFLLEKKIISKSPALIRKFQVLWESGNLCFCRINHK